ncbi:hypothetical protein [Paludisphaera mucosa]|uniref:Uncharacterized protein n=1 Tax=Paludisphaera mucosa TaxID=3030827 RepID=A0ABT6FBE4_9BACT|nr:hypothetical protein [Paludisphaera mucosa]MDG3004912.1 hypothetical protein [Paludisphaera mucosa]
MSAAPEPPPDRPWWFQDLGILLCLVGLVHRLFFGMRPEETIARRPALGALDDVLVAVASILATALLIRWPLFLGRTATAPDASPRVRSFATHYAGVYVLGAMPLTTALERHTPLALVLAASTASRLLITLVFAIRENAARNRREVEAYVARRRPAPAAQPEPLAAAGDGSGLRSGGRPRPS